MERWFWVNYQFRGVLLMWIRVGQGPAALVVGAGGGCLDIFSLIYHFSFLSPSHREMARYRLKYCLKGPLSPKQPTNQIMIGVKYCLINIPPSYCQYFLIGWLLVSWLGFNGPLRQYFNLYRGVSQREGEGGEK